MKRASQGLKIEPWSWDGTGSPPLKTKPHHMKLLVDETNACVEVSCWFCGKPRPVRRASTVAKVMIEMVSGGKHYRGVPENRERTPHVLVYCFGFSRMCLSIRRLLLGLYPLHQLKQKYAHPENDTVLFNTTSDSINQNSAPGTQIVTKPIRACAPML